MTKIDIYNRLRVHAAWANRDCRLGDQEAFDLAAGEIDRLTAERDAAIKSFTEAATMRGRAEGKLAASELPGIIDGWKDRAEKAEAERDQLAAQYTTACQTIEKMATDRDQALALLAVLKADRETRG